MRIESSAVLTAQDNFVFTASFKSLKASTAHSENHRSENVAEPTDESSRAGGGIAAVLRGGSYPRRAPLHVPQSQLLPPAICQSDAAIVSCLAVIYELAAYEWEQIITSDNTGPVSIYGTWRDTIRCVHTSSPEEVMCGGGYRVKSWRQRVENQTAERSLSVKPPPAVRYERGNIIPEMSDGIRPVSCLQNASDGGCKSGGETLRINAHRIPSRWESDSALAFGGGGIDSQHNGFHMESTSTASVSHKGTDVNEREVSSNYHFFLMRSNNSFNGRSKRNFPSRVPSLSFDTMFDPVKAPSSALGVRLFLTSLSPCGSNCAYGLDFSPVKVYTFILPRRLAGS
ncbi:hypothetical protein F2P81_022554 [Scophthalmus maximus]|uniref:Uncharacterized protein n=1 Tax=Scophthalmus maximus TaxID=52904 RepID=A0A6A4RUK3_SCOMX|nr:hypothetical protein F2P81_022554 [Scophthalmus maximus]